MTMVAATMLVRFDQPWALAATAAACLPIVVALWARKRGRHVAAGCVALQCVAILAAAAALARPAARIGADAVKPTLVLQDVSGSVRNQPPLPDWPDDVPRDEFIFAADVAAAGQDAGPTRTRAAAALRLATARAHALAGVVIRTDGRFQDAWSAAADALGRTGVDVLIVPMQSPPADARVAELSARRRPDGRADLRVTVASNARQRRTLTVRRERPAPRALLERELSMTAGDSATIRLTDSPPSDRGAVYRAVLSGDDAFAENDAAETLLLPQKNRVAVVTRAGVSLPSGSVPSVAVAPADAPTDPAGWTDYAAVVLVDATGTLLSRPQRQALAGFVRGGGGLVLLGAAPHGTPDDREDPLTRVAALMANPYQRKPMKIVVVLDASGSMAEPADGPGGRKGVKFDQACEAVLSLRRHLTPADALSVVTFSDSPRRVYDSGAAAIDYAALREAMRGVRPGGPTRVAGALKLAAADDVAPPRTGLVLLVTDMITERFDAAAIAKSLRDRDLSLAVVVTQSTADPAAAAAPLERLADLLGAPLVRRDGLTGLADVFAGFLRSARGDAIRRGSFRVTAGEGPPPAADAPPLEAYLLAAPAVTALVSLRVEADPLLARRQVGLGRSVTLSLPLDAGLNAGWRKSAYLRQLLDAAVQWALRPETDPRFAGEFVDTGDGLRLTVEAVDGPAPMNTLDLTADLTTWEGRSASVALSQVAPGQYEADLPAPEAATAIRVRDAAGRVVWRGTVPETGGREFDALGADQAALRNLAERTGGRIVHDSAVSAWLRRATSEQDTPLWYWLLALAAGAMLTEWAVSRIWRR
jgi:hypothetical protein